MAKQIHRYLRDDGEGGRLDQFGELRPNEGGAQQRVRIGVDHQFRPTIEAGTVGKHSLAKAFAGRVKAIEARSNAGAVQLA